MTNYITARRGDTTDTYAIQSAIDRAYESGSMNVLVPEGIWRIETPIYIREGIQLVLDGAHLCCTGEDGYCIRNSHILKNKIRSKYGLEMGFSTVGQNGATIEGAGGIYLYNAGRFTVEGVDFACAKAGITLLYCHHLRLRNLRFTGGERGVEVLVGTRDGFFTDLAGECGTLLTFDSARREEVVYYNGPDVRNHIARGIRGTCREAVAVLAGGNTGDIILSEISGEVPASLVRITEADNITVTGTAGAALVNEDHHCQRLFAAAK